MTLPKPRRLSYTVWGPGAGPQAGDLIRCRNKRTGQYTGTDYVVIRSKFVKNTSEGRRLSLVVIRVDADFVWPPDHCRFDMWWNSRTWKKHGAPPSEYDRNRAHRG